MKKEIIDSDIYNILDKDINVFTTTLWEENIKYTTYTHAIKVKLYGHNK